MNESTFNKLFDKKVKAKYLGFEVYVEPIEELLVGRAFMHREKDLNDLELLKNCKFDNNKIKELAEEWGDAKNTLKTLKEKGYNI